MGILDKLIGKKEKEAKKTEEKPVGVEVGKKAEIEKEKKKSVAERKEAVDSKKAVKSKKEVKARKVAKVDENIAHKILLEGLISEKATMLAPQNKYVFKVHPKAGKYDIKKAVEGYYGVQVIGVHTIKIHPKKRIHGRTIGWKKGFKKAVVTLKEGDTIAAVEGI